MAADRQLRIRPFAHGDKTACLRIFDSNLPYAMTPEERDGFAIDLDDTNLAYFVVEDEAGDVIACGGFEAGSTTLCWGMVHRKYHRKGVGTFLLLERLRRLFELRGPCEVCVDTSQYGRPFL